MIVPPFVPEPIEVEGNVALEKPAVRLRFLRRVVAWHFLSALLVAGLAFSPLPSLPTAASIILLLASMLVLSFTRQLTRPRPVDQIYSIVLSPVLFISLAMVLNDLAEAGWPVWAPLITLFCGLVYTVLSGNDFSFVWLYLLAVAASSLVIIFSWLMRVQAIDQPVLAIAIAAAYFLYFVYDLACLQSRRRTGEVAGAVVDLYRDPLNIFTYSIRVVLHWKRYRIWAPK